MGVRKQLRKALTADQIERNNTALENDFKWFSDFEQSEKLKEYVELCSLVSAVEFINDKKKTEGLSYKNSELRKKEKIFTKLSKDKKIIAFLRLSDSSDLSFIESFISSEEYKEYSGLSSKSGKFTKEDNIRLKELKNDANLRRYLSVIKSKDYKYYNQIKDSKVIEEYFLLKEYIESDDFKTEKEFLVNKKRYETTDDFKKLQRYNELKEDDEIIKYLKYKDSDAFDELKKWQLTFEDDFNSDNLDKSSWINRHRNGDELLGCSYSLEGDKHYFNEDKNIRLENSNAIINTRKEKVRAKSWDGILGFSEREHDYTSGMISTGNHFRQKYGRFEAKVKIGKAPLTHCFWLMSDYVIPHIDVFKILSDNSFVCSSFVDENKGSLQKLKLIDLSEDFFIYKVVWTPKSICWYINDVLVYEEFENIPDAELFLSLGTCVYADVDAKHLPSDMKIDWVRCYKKAE